MIKKTALVLVLIIVSGNLLTAAEAGLHPQYLINLFFIKNSYWQNKHPDLLSQQEIDLLIASIYQDLITGEQDGDIIAISKIICAAQALVFKKYVGRLESIKADSRIAAQVQMEMAWLIKNQIAQYSQRR